MKTYSLPDSERFKEENLLNWERNTEFWLSARLRHVLHVLPTATAIVTREANTVGPGFTVVDVGCGNAWLLRLLRQISAAANYVGLDFNRAMIDHVREQYQDDRAASFEVVDIESKCPRELQGSADLVVNAFNFFELANLAAAFDSSVAMLRQNGGLLVFHIDPLSQLLSLVSTMEDLRQELTTFEEHGSRRAYDKLIDLQDGDAQQVYKGILYKISEYHRFARFHGLQLEDFEEILHVKDGRPQWYQVAFWRRARERV